MSTEISPSPNGSNGDRDTLGRFAKGNRGGPGNPYARHAARFHSVVVNAVTDEDLRAIFAKLVEQAKAGDLAAIREVFNRTIGRPFAPLDPTLVTNDDILNDEEAQSARRARVEALLDALPEDHQRSIAQILAVMAEMS